MRILSGHAGTGWIGCGKKPMKKSEAPIAVITGSFSDVWIWPLQQEDTGLEALPVDERLQAVKEGKEDIGLVSLYFQYGRISADRFQPGRKPAGKPAGDLE